LPRKADSEMIIAKQEEAFKTRKTDMMVSRAKRITAEEQEMFDKPTINATSKTLAAKRTKNIPIQARYEDELRQREAKIMKLKSQLEQAKVNQQEECTFYPKMSRSRSRSLRVERPNLVDPTSAFQQKQQKLAQLKLDYLVEESQNLTFKPNINKKSSDISLKSREGNFLERMDRYQNKIKAKKEALEIEFLAEQAPFRPNLSKNRSEKSLPRVSDAKNLSRQKSKPKKPNGNKEKIAKLKNILSQSKQIAPKKRLDESDEFDHSALLDNGDSDNLLDGIQTQFSTNKAFNQSVVSERVFKNNHLTFQFEKPHRISNPKIPMIPESNKLANQRDRSSRSRSANKSPGKPGDQMRKVPKPQIEASGGYHPSIRGILMKPF
jgi:hypothetical protein